MAQKVPRMQSNTVPLGHRVRAVLIILNPLSPRCLFIKPDIQRREKPGNEPANTN